MSDNSWRLALGGMTAMAAGMGIGRFVYTPILPIMVEALHLTSAEAGLIASANFLGYLAGALLAASPVLRGSRRSYLVGGLAANALTLAAMGLTPHFAAHLVLRFFGGLASAFILVFASALVLDRLAASGRDRLSAVHFGGVGGGIAVSAVAVAALAAAGIGWQGLWLASGVLGLLGLAVVAWLMPNEEVAQVSGTTGEAAPASFALRAIIAAYGLFGFGYVITATFVVAMVRTAPEISALEPYIWALLGLSAVPSVALWMADRIAFRGAPRLRGGMSRRSGRRRRQRALGLVTGHSARGGLARWNVRRNYGAGADRGTPAVDRRSPPQHRADDCVLRRGTGRGTGVRRLSFRPAGKLYHALSRGCGRACPRRRAGGPCGRE